MRIAVGIPLFNEEMFVKQSVRNCIDVGYDHVIYLDDGSTDGSYEKLEHYTKDYDHIKVLRNTENSVISGQGNRWEIVSEECRKYDPDWILVRAADEALSYPAFDGNESSLKNSIKILEEKHKADMLVFSYVDLWRSKFWYRTDGYWRCRSSINGWKNKGTGWKFKYGSGIHLGAHRPNVMSVNAKTCAINLGSNRNITVLHYGMSSHELLVRKLEYTINTTNKIKRRANGVPLKIPSPSNWKSFNGYKVADERGIRLEKARQVWFKNEIPNEPRPTIKSLYTTVLKYDEKVAEEYAKIYGR